MECAKDRNKVKCTCTYSCSKRGLCCACVEYHRSLGEVPGCFFSKEGERTYDRSPQNLVRTLKR